MKKRLLAAIALVVLNFGGAYAQQDPQFTQYLYNGIYFNPAMAGMDGQAARFQSLFRRQWWGLSGGGEPTTGLISFNSPLLRYSSGVGVHIAYDALGPNNNLEAQASYAYHLPLGTGKLSLGAKLGIFNKSVNKDKLREAALDKDDPLLQGGNVSSTAPDAALGVFYRNDKFFGGLSFNHILQSEFDLGGRNDSTAKSPLQTHMYIQGGYNLELTPEFLLTPSILIRSATLAKVKYYTADVCVMGTYNNKMYAGLSYRSNDAASITLGTNLLDDNSLRLLYSFDLTVPQTKAKGLTSHELSVAYSIPVFLYGAKPIIRSPRYRK